MKYSSMYQNTSEAYSFDYDYVPVRRGRIGKHQEKEELKVVRNNHTESSHINAKIILSIVVIFVFSIITISYYAANNKIRIRNNELVSEVNMLKESNAVLQAEISKSIDLKEVEKIATTRLGMQEPLSYQVVYINVPKQSYTIQHETIDSNVKSETFSISNIINYFTKE